MPVIAPFGSKAVTIPSGEKIAIATRGAARYASKDASSGKVLDSANPVYDVEIIAEETVSSAFSTGGEVRVENMGPYPCFYEVGTAPLSKDFRRESGILGAGAALNSTGTVTTAMILGGLLTSTTGSAVTATLETGAVMDASTEWAIGEGFNWGVVNTGGANAITITAAASGHTVVGAGAVAASTSGLFRTVKTAANTFVTSRIG